jgi:hypothetical protein
MIRLKDQTLFVETGTLTAEITRGFLTSLRARDGAAPCLQTFDVSAGSALQLVYASGEVIGFGPDKPVQIVARLLSDHQAEVRFHGWDADGLLAIRECPETGALLVEPSGFSSRPGVLACRWNLCGIAEGMELVAPFYQGVRLGLQDELIRDSRWVWPFQWEAGLAILAGKTGGFWVHAQDTRYRYKALKVGSAEDARCLGFDTEAYGPVDSNLGAGGLCWRVNVFHGDWQVPARQYRHWLWQAYDLKPRQDRRKVWMHDIRLAIGWCNGELELLDALGARIDPKKVLIHFSNWRTDAYDENYPNYVASDRARAFMAKGAAMGFHILPHCNSIDMDPTHPVYPSVRDFQYREAAGKNLQGWAWDTERHVSLRVPNSNVALLENRHRKVMVKIHPGLAMWRSILAESIQKGLADLPIDAVFIDVTLCTWNLHNCLVENVTGTEGMKRLIDHVADIRTAAAQEGLVVGGEGLNEIIAQGLSIGQVHLFRSSGPSIRGLERTGGCALNALLFEGLARTFGYSGLTGRNEDEILRSDLHLSHGAIPTITGPSPADILQPNPYVRQSLERAADGGR